MSELTIPKQIAPIVAAPADGYESKAVMCGPQEARALLALAPARHRKPSAQRIRAFLGAIKNGEWLAGSQIRIAETVDGLVLTGGVARLTAIERSGETVAVSVVISGMDPLHDYQTNDAQIRRRTINNSIKAIDSRGLMEANIPRVRAFLSACQFIAAGFSFEPHYVSVNDTYRAVEEYAASRDRIIDAFQWISQTKTIQGLLRKTPLALALVTFRYAPDVALRFWPVAAANDGLNVNDPRRQLLRGMTTNNNTPGGQQRQRRDWQIALMCWDAFANNKHLDKFNFARRIDAIALTPIRLKRDASDTGADAIQVPNSYAL